MRNYSVVLTILFMMLFSGAADAAPKAEALHPRPSGYQEAGVPGQEAQIAFQRVVEQVGLVYDTQITFGHEAAPAFHSSPQG